MDEFHAYTADKSRSGGSNLGMLPQKSTTPPSYQLFEPSARKVNKLDNGFTINQLNFGNTLYGRETEIQQLSQALEDVVNHEQKKKKQFVLVSGYSGTGKTALANTLQVPVLQKQKGLFVRGKFDEHQKEPYSALADVCETICMRILSLQQESPDAFHALCACMEESLGPELEVLLRVFPILKEIFGSSMCMDVGSRSSATSLQNPMDAKKRLNYAFCRWMRIITQEFHPLVLVLDDLQRADEPSLDLLDALLMDHDDSTQQLLIIGIYRSNEVIETQPLSSHLRKWHAKEKDDSFCMQEIHVENLTLEAVHHFVNDILSISDSTQTLGLASLCHKRTMGNVFFLTLFLRLLHRDQLLTYNFGLMKWTWDLHEIELKTRASENVVDVLLEKMKGLSNNQSEILCLAACLGSTFEENTLVLLLQEMRREEHKTDVVPGTVKCDLECLIADGYLQDAEIGKYSFSHDKIQEAASLLIPKEADRLAFRQLVGQTLLTCLQPKDLESDIFVVVNLLNEGELPMDGAQRLELAQLNRQACTKAMAVSAFDAASSYASRGVSLLGETPFPMDNREVALDLFAAGAAAESCLGNAKKMESYCKTVMQETDLPIKDKLQVYMTWLDSLADRGYVKEAAMETLDLLRQFGIVFPRIKVIQSLRTLLHIRKVKKAACNGRLLEDILALPVESDPTRIQLLQLIDRLGVYLFISQHRILPLVLFRSFDWTLKYGRSDVTPSTLTTLGVIFAGVMGNLRLGSELAQTALKLIPKSSPLVESRTLLVAHCFGVVWTQPIRAQLKPLERAYKSGLCSGDTESACWAIHNFCHMRYLTSFSLDLCIADIEIYLQQMKGLNQIVAYRSTVLSYQMFTNLAGRTKTDPLSLVGDYCTAENHRNWLMQDSFYETQCRILECYILTMYGEHEACAKLAVKYGPFAAMKSHPGALTVILFDVVSKGISSFIAARRTGKKAYRRSAFAIRRRIKDWVDKGNPNVVHFNSFFDAQFATLNGERRAAILSYQAAIVIARRGGFLLEAGLFSELFGEYLLDVGGDSDEASYRLEEATKYYEEFGARRKVEMIESRHRALLINHSRYRSNPVNPT